MLCVSSCHSDCFEINGLDFYFLIGKLRKVPSSVGSPVLGCRANAKTPSHEKTFCFGFLSEEHIIALSVFMNNHLQIDLLGCADCRNSFIIAVLEKRIRDVEAKTSIGAVDKVRLIKNKTDLDFQEVSDDRRSFFKALKNFTLMQAAGLFGDEDNGEEMRAYSAKKLPFKRELLNGTLKVLPEETRKALLKNYYYTVDATDTCNNCFACIGMCPTGALKIESKCDDRELFFSTSLCNGCGLCESFCMSSSVAIERGFSGDNPFEFISAKKELLCEA
jgi:ferredoxin